MKVTKEENSKKKRNLGWWIAALAVVIVLGIIFGPQIFGNGQNADVVFANIETESYQRQTIHTNIYGTGSAEPVQSATLTWETGGIVGEVNVSLGQEVAEGALMTALTPASVSADILQAQVDVVNAQNSLDALYENWEADLAQAKLDLLNAQEDLDDLATDRKIMNYQRCTDERLQDLEDELDQAELIYKYRQNADTLRAVNTAQANLDYCNAGYTAQEIAEAELKVELAEAKVADLQKQVDILINGPDPDQVTILEIQLAIAHSRAESPTIKAPFDGVVTDLSVQTGDVVQTGSPAVRLDDLSELFLDVQISEIDIPYIEVGQPVELVFDAYYEDTFQGEVIEISPVGSTVQGVVEYAVRIKLLDADDRIKSGMTAAVSIVVERKEDVFVVPNNAIVSQDGHEVVYVKRNGSFEAVQVTLGSYSDYYSEVLEADIDEGELIAISPPAELTGEAMVIDRSSAGGFGMFGN
jgi:HlyD family secretion protein